MTANVYDICVIGAGVNGAATAYFAAKAGARVLLLEQFEVGHGRGSSHGNSRIFRHSYEHSDYTELAREALLHWRAIEAESGNQLLFMTGGIDMGPPDNADLQACIATVKSGNLEHELLDSAALEKRFPQFRVAPSTVGLFQKDAGILDADLCVRSMVQLAVKHGANLLQQTEVISIRRSGQQVQLATASASYSVGNLVVCAGAWVGPLLTQVGVNLPVRVRKEQLFFFKTTKPELFQKEVFPVFIEYGLHGPQGAGASSGIGCYGFPIFEMDAVKVACHQAGPFISANENDLEIEPEGRRVLLEYVKERFGGLLTDVVASKTCPYTNTPNFDFIVDSLPGQKELVVVSACSGHGFKFAPATGKMAAELALEGRSVTFKERFSLARHTGTGQS